MGQHAEDHAGKGTRSDPSTSAEPVGVFPGTGAVPQPNDSGMPVEPEESSSADYQAHVEGRFEGREVRAEPAREAPEKEVSHASDP